MMNKKQLKFLMEDYIDTANIKGFNMNIFMKAFNGIDVFFEEDEFLETEEGDRSY